MELWLTFFGVAAAGGLLVFLVLRRDRRPPSAGLHPPDEGPRFEAGRDGARDGVDDGFRRRR